LIGQFRSGIGSWPKLPAAADAVNKSCLPLEDSINDNEDYEYFAP